MRNSCFPRVKAAFHVTSFKGFHRCACAILLLWFNSYSVRAEDLIAIYNQAALEDPQLEKAREALAAVQESRSQTSSSLFQPNINISAGVGNDWPYFTNTGLCERDNTCGNGLQKSFNWNYQLSLSQPILHVDRFVQWRQADSKIAQAEAQYAAAESSLLLRVTERYFDVLAAGENLAFAQSQQDSLGRQLKETQQLEAAGYLALTDVQEAQSGFDRAAADTVEADRLLKNARESGV